MGNSSKTALDPKLRFHDGYFHKLVLKHHFGRIFAIDILQLKESNEILICTVSKDGRILLYKLHDRDIQNYTSKKKAKTIKNTSFLTAAIPCRSSYNMALSMTYNQETKSVFVSNGGLDNVCNVHQYNLQTRTHQRYNEIEKSEGYTASIKFMEDNSNRIIWGSGDCNVYIADYINNEHLLKISIAKYDVTQVDCYNTDGDMLIIGIASVDCCIYIITIDDSDHSDMKIINSQRIEVGKSDINCIAFAPSSSDTFIDRRFIACGGDDGDCVILIKNKVIKDNIIEYDILTTETVSDSDKYLSLTTCCWLDENTLIIGTDVECDVLNVFRINAMKNDEKCLKIICEFVNEIEYIGQIILDFCGYDLQKWCVKSTFAENSKVTQIKALPNYKIAPGIFVVSSWDYTSCLYIPIR